jgi:tetratricopeptide (TPR) repeat protein
MNIGVLRTFLAVLLLLFFSGTEGVHGASESYRSGVDLFRDGHFEEAAAKFEDALREDPSSSEPLRSLAHTLAALGQQKFRKGDLESAADYFEEAVDKWPEEEAFHFLLAVTYFRSGDYYGARRAAEEALDLEENHFGSRELLGDIYYQDGYLNRAIPEWEAALEAGAPRASQLREKIARAEKESDAESGFGRDVSVHFTLQYDEPVPRNMVRVILDYLEEAYDDIGEELGTYPSGDIPVILYSKILFTEITRNPLWVAGSFDGKIRLPVGGLSDPRAAVHLRPVLTHELAHAFIRRIAPGGLPLWFEEGLAKHFEGLTTERAEALLGGTGTSPPTTFEALTEGLRGRGGRVKSSYLAALLAVRLLIEDEGFWTVRRILEAVGRGQTFEEALRGEARLDLAEFEERWRSSLP